MPSIRLPLVVAFVGLALMGVVPAAASENPAGQLAMFEGRVLDMAADWGEAQACAVWETGAAECFRTEAELDLRIAQRQAAAPLGPSESAQAQCGSYLRLYDGTSYSGTVLHLSTRLIWINLSSYGFSNRTSSYKVGGCSAYFADYSSGGGSWYPTGSTQAYDQASVMASGWDNRVSSVYIT